jgi:hypothetical protein
MRGDGRVPYTWATAAEQRAALSALAETIKPSALVLPDAVLKRLPPRPDGYDMTRELFPRYTGMTFDVITPAVVAAYHTASNMLQPDRAARTVEQHAVDPSLPGLEDVIDELFAASFGASAATPYEAEISRAVERVVIEQLVTLAASAAMPQVRAIATFKLGRTLFDLNEGMTRITDAGEAAHTSLLARDIKRFMDDPDAFKRQAPPAVPPGAPIGEPGLNWLGLAEPPCSVWDTLLRGFVIR